MGVAVWKGALFALLLAYNWRGCVDVLRSRANAFLSPAGVGPPEALLQASLAQEKPAHARLRFTADLHASSLLSSRDLLARAHAALSPRRNAADPNPPQTRAQQRCSWRRCTRSAVDLPRLLEGHVAVQFLSVFTSLPNAPLGVGCPGRSAHSSLGGLLCGTGGASGVAGEGHGRSDAAAALSLLLQGAPLRALYSPAARLEHSLRRAWSAAARSGGALQVLTSRDELELFVVQRALCAAQEGPPGCRFAAAVLAVEGAEAMEGRDAVAAADALFERGVRSVALHHARANACGRSAHDPPASHGDADPGLSEWGLALLGRLQELGVLVDLSHSSDALIRHATAVATKPMALTHVVPASAAQRCARAGGALGRPPGQAGAPVAVVDDRTLSSFAAAGGVVGVSFAACVDPSGAAVDADPIRDVASRVTALLRSIGAQHVALGSDWDGGVVLPAALGARGMALLGAALRKEGLSEADLGAVMGGNALSLLRSTLPSDLQMAETAARGTASRRVTTVGEEGTVYDVWL